MNVFQRQCKIDSLKGKALASYTPGELVSYCTTAFPGDPRGALKSMRDNYEIGSILYEETDTLLEVLQNVKRNKTCKTISEQRDNRRCGS